MKDFILKILKESIPGPEVEKRALTRKEVTLFKYLNQHKKEAKTKEGLMKVIKTMMGVLGLPENDYKLYYEVYSANYRPDGDYENITPEEFRDYRLFKTKKTPNNEAYEYTSAKIPFKGSNLEGEWKVNNNNQWYYVVESYGWYPIFLYINDQWYRVLDSYSSSTRKHLSGANPIHWNSGLKANVVGVTRSEMSNLMNGRYDLEGMKSSRVPNFVKNMKNQLVSSKKLISSGWGDDAVRVSYIITDIFEADGKIKIVVRVNKAGRMEGRKMVVNPDYQNDERLVNDIETAIKQNIIRTNPEYLTDDNVEIDVIH
jgi:ribosomal protein S15P/S13E